MRRTLSDAAINRRYKEINTFERQLRDRGTQVVKLCLHISYDEQRNRLLRRLRDPTKQWKFSEHDIHERGYWDDYMAAFDAAITATATAVAPWFIIPSDHKWFRNLAISSIIVETLESLDMQFPRPAISPLKRDSSS